jgi:hypothetical protein
VIRIHRVSNRREIETQRSRFIFRSRGNRSAMVGDLIMLPVRVGVRATRLWLRAAEETVAVATRATGRLIGMASQDSGNGADASGPARHARDRTGAEEFATPGEPSTDVGVIERAAAAARRPPSEETAPGTEPGPPETFADRGPAHVSEEPALVEEFAEPGAEEGAGAEVHIEEPWDGYAHMSAKQITARLSTATPAELAAVQLYETAHRSRQTVLNAAQRELRRTNGRSSRSQ